MEVIPERGDREEKDGDRCPSVDLAEGQPAHSDPNLLWWPAKERLRSRIGHERGDGGAGRRLAGDYAT